MSLEVICLFLGLGLMFTAYLLPGIFMTYDSKEGLRLLEEREAANERRPPIVWWVFIYAVFLWPWVDWKRVETHQNWAEYIQRENSDDDDSDEPPRSDEENREGGD